MSNFTLTLAISDVELIVSAIGIIIVIGSQIVAALRKKEARPAAAARRQDKAARRAEMFHALGIEVESEESAPTAAPPSGDRAGGPAKGGQARTIYERRAEALRLARQRQQSSAPADTLHPPTQSAADREAAAIARAQAKRREAEIGRQRQMAELERQRQQIEQQQRLQREQRALAQRRAEAQRLAKETSVSAGPPAARAKAPRSGRTVAATSMAPGASSTQRLVADSDSPAYDIHQRSQSPLRAALTGRSLRTAVLLAEVLGKPMALREAEQQPGMTS